MARKDEIQYVRYYAVGTAARKLEPEQEQRRKARPAAKPKEERIPIPFDLVAVFGTAVAVVMILCVLVGFAQVNRVNDQIAAMEQHISALKNENYVLQKEYESSYDLEQIRIAAEAMGLVPIEQVQHITIHIPEPDPAAELSWWEEMWNDFKGMFE